MLLTLYEKRIIHVIMVTKNNIYIIKMLLQQCKIIKNVLLSMLFIIMVFIPFINIGITNTITVDTNTTDIFKQIGIGPSLYNYTAEGYNLFFLIFCISASIFYSIKPGRLGIQYFYWMLNFYYVMMLYMLFGMVFFLYYRDEFDSKILFFVTIVSLFSKLLYLLLMKSYYNILTNSN